MKSLDESERRTMQGRRVSESRAQSVGTGSAGGFVVSTGFQAELARALKDFGGVREVARVLPTSSGNDIEWPAVDDTGNTGALLAENTQDAEQDIALSQITLKAYKYTSKIVRVSLELLQDSEVGIDGLLSEMFAERLGRIHNAHFTTGDNASKPQGIVTAANVGKTAASATAIAADELFDLQHSLDPAWRKRGATWMMSDSTLKAVRLLKDTTNQYLFRPGLAAGVADTILGDPFVINQDVPAIATTAKSIAYGDFSQYVIRDVRDITLLRLEERYADFFQVGFVAFSRNDGRLVSGNTGAQNPIQVLQQA